jgi:hypothetical protein
MRIFVSWSGGRSRELALALREWLPLVLHYAQPWMSDVDIAAGQRWGARIAERLNSSEYGIICCTAENLAAPWLMFEAGALAGALAEDAVCPLLLNVPFSALSGPLAQFQAKKSDEDGLTGLVSAINRKAGHPVPEDRLHELFQVLWPRLRDQLNTIAASAEAQSQARPQGEMLEELLAGDRRIESRLSAIEQRLPPENSEVSLPAEPPPGSVMAEVLRRGVERRVEETSLRSVARDIGMSPMGVRHFTLGATPCPATLRKLRRWYARNLREQAHLPSGWNAIAAARLEADSGGGATRLPFEEMS